MSLDEKQLALRRTGVTGTDIGAILGLSSFRTPLDVWLDKTGQAPAVTPTDDMERGTFLEDGARRWYAHRTGAIRVEEPGTVVSARNPLVIATPDGLSHFEDGMVCGLEIKMPGRSAGWGEPGTDDVPEWVLPQVAWGMAALEKERWDVFAVLDGKPRIYRVFRDRELEGLLVEQAERFWRDYVLTGRPPEVTHHDEETVTRWLGRHSQEQHLDFATLAPEAKVVLEAYLRAYQEESAASERLALWETRAKLLLGGAPGVRELPEETGFKRLDWRQNKPGKKTDWHAVVEEVAASITGAAALRPIIERHTTTTEGARPFVPRPLKRGTR